MGEVCRRTQGQQLQGHSVRLGLQLIFQYQPFFFTVSSRFRALKHFNATAAAPTRNRGLYCLVLVLVLVLFSP